MVDNYLSRFKKKKKKMNMNMNFMTYEFGL